MQEIISSRGCHECRSCGSTHLNQLLDLGLHPIPSEYGLTPDDVIDAFPLRISICSCCGLGQIPDIVPRERIFHSHYPYISSASNTWLNHVSQFATDVVSSLSLSSHDLVLELASNDGHLLSVFQSYGLPVLGVEPAKNLADYANSKSIDTLNSFFGVDLADQIVTDYGSPRLIIANNVFAHVPDLNDFTAGIARLCSDSTIVTIENPSFLTLLQNNLFDTIYHEHYSYHSVHSVNAITQAHGLTLFHVDKLATHGGSNRYWLSKHRLPDNTVAQALAHELDHGLFSESLWTSFSDASQKSVENLRQWLLKQKSLGNTIAAYGAAHKGNTLLNAVGTASQTIKYVIDASSEKQGKFCPGSQLPVYPPTHLQHDPVSDILILPWNIKTELATLARSYLPDCRVWIAQPTLQQL